MKKDNIKRKYRKYKSGIFYSFGLLPYFVLILFVLVGQILFNFQLLVYSESEMDRFSKGASRQYQASVGTYLSNILKFKFDKFVTDFAGQSETLVTAATTDYIFAQAKSVTEKRSNILFDLLNYLYEINANSTDTFGLNQFHQYPCASIADSNINLFNMTEKYVPESFCASNANGLTRISFLRSILWTTDIEAILFETLMF